MIALIGTSWLSTVLDVAVRSTALLTIVVVVVRVSMRWRPSFAATVANAGFAGLLFLPLAVATLPPLAVACLPAFDERPAPVPSVSVGSRSSDAVHDESAEIRSMMPGTQDAEIERLRSASTRTDTVSLEPGASPSHAAGVRVESVDSRVLSPAARSFSLALLGVASYVLAVTLLVARLIHGLSVVIRLRRDAISVDDPAWNAALERWHNRLGLKKRVRLAWSAAVSVPVVVGWRRPEILLPTSAAALDPDQHADAVLLHELAHVRRGDYAWNVFQQLVVSIYGFHPLAWLLARSASEARERACDAFSIHEMGGATRYRATLLAIASELVRRPQQSLGLAMARSPGLARRLAAIDRSRGSSRCLPGWTVRFAIAIVGLALAMVVSVARLTRSEAPPAVDKAEAAQAETKGKAVSAPVKVLHLQVVSAESGKPVPNANVRVWIDMRDEWRITDERGRLDIRHSTGPGDKNVGVDVWGDGFAMQRHNWGYKPGEPVPGEATVKLIAGESLGGTVQDEQGRPIAGATVYLWSHNYKKNTSEILFDLRATTDSAGRWKTSGAPETTGELLGISIDHPDYLSDRDYMADRAKPRIADLRAGTAVSVMTKGVPIEGRVVDAYGQPVAGATVYSSRSQDHLGNDVREFAVSTDDAGHFRTGQVRSETNYLVAIARGHAPGERSVDVGKAVPQIEIRLGRPRAFVGRVVDSEGKPVENAFVNVDSWRRYRFLRVFLYTDHDGRFRWDDAPDDPLEINVHRQGYVGISRQRVEPSAEDVTFTLKASLSVHGKVLDAETKKRVERAAIEYGEADPKTGDVAKWVAMPSTGIGVVVFKGDLNLNIPVAADAYRFRLVAEGYEPFVSRVIRRDETAVYDYDINLAPIKPGAEPVATVLRPDGKPLVGARVYRGVLNESNLNLQDGEVHTGRESGRDIRTSAEGTFTVTSLAKPWMVLIVGDDCFAYASKDAIAASPNIQARPYATVEGRYLIGSRPGAKLRVELSGHIQDRSTMFCHLFFHASATTDDEGRFRFEKVMPTSDLRVGRRDPGNATDRVWSLGVPVHVDPGASVTVAVGGTGRSVVGRVEPPEGWTAPIDFTQNARASIESNRPFIPYPLSLFRGKTSLQGGAWSEWSQRWRESPEGQAYSDRRVAVAVGLSPDGSFRLDDLPAGEYRLTVYVNEPRPFGETGPFARLVQVFTIPPIPGGRTDETFDVGMLRLRRRAVLKAGDSAPPFEVTTVDGKTLAVPGDFKGKVLLLDFGTLWDQQSAFQITRMNDVYKRFGDDPRFAILSLTLAPDDAETRKYIAEKGEPWPQAIVGNLSNPIASAYGVHDENVHGAILIGPDGKLIAAGLYYDKIGKLIAEALEKN